WACSPPPETVAVLLIAPLGGGELVGNSAVKVRLWLAPAARAVVPVQVSVWFAVFAVNILHVNPLSVDVWFTSGTRPAAPRSSVTVMVDPSVGSVPMFDTAMVYVTGWPGTTVCGFCVLRIVKSMWPTGKAGAVEQLSVSFDSMIRLLGSMQARFGSTS